MKKKPFRTYGSVVRHPVKYENVPVPKALKRDPKFMTLIRFQLLESLIEIQREMYEGKMLHILYWLDK